MPLYIICTEWFVNVTATRGARSRCKSSQQQHKKQFVLACCLCVYRLHFAVRYAAGCLFFVQKFQCAHNPAESFALLQCSTAHIVNMISTFWVYGFQKYMRKDSTLNMLCGFLFAAAVHVPLS